MRENLTDIEDDHLYTLEFHIHRIIKERNLCIKSMMRDKSCSAHSSASADKDVAMEEKEVESDDVSSDNESTSITADFSSKVLNKKLRCVKV